VGPTCQPAEERKERVGQLSWAVGKRVGRKIDRGPAEIKKRKGEGDEMGHRERKKGREESLRFVFFSNLL
jgi:hypothetical protein